MKLWLRKAEAGLDSKLDKLKRLLQESRIVQAMCSRYGVDTEKILEAPIKFTDLPVSAKTKDKVIYINTVFAENGEFDQEVHYLVHELCHWLQQLKNDPFKLVKEDKRDYLDLPSEMEAFIFQVQFMREMYGDKFAEAYVEDLLDFHECNGERRDTKRRQLLMTDN